MLQIFQKIDKSLINHPQLLVRVEQDLVPGRFLWNRSRSQLDRVQKSENWSQSRLDRFQDFWTRLGPVP